MCFQATEESQTEPLRVSCLASSGQVLTIEGATGEHLLRTGPLVPVVIVGAHGVERGYALIDSGSSTTCVTLDAAERLKLRHTSRKPGYSAGGPTTNAHVETVMQIPIKDEAGKQITVQIAGEFAALPDLERYYRDLDLKAGAETVNVIGLIGRDILKYGSLLYDGARCRWELQFDPEAIGRADDRAA